MRWRGACSQVMGIQFAGNAPASCSSLFALNTLSSRAVTELERGAFQEGVRIVGDENIRRFQDAARRTDGYSSLITCSAENHWLSNTEVLRTRPHRGR